MKRSQTHILRGRRREDVLEQLGAGLLDERPRSMLVDLVRVDQIVRETIEGLLLSAEGRHLISTISVGTIRGGTKFFILREKTNTRKSCNISGSKRECQVERKNHFTRKPAEPAAFAEKITEAEPAKNAEKTCRKSSGNAPRRADLRISM